MNIPSGIVYLNHRAEFQALTRFMGQRPDVVFREFPSPIGYYVYLAIGTQRVDGGSHIPAAYLEFAPSSGYWAVKDVTVTPTTDHGPSYKFDVRRPERAGLPARNLQTLMQYLRDNGFGDEAGKVQTLSDQFPR